MRLLRLSVSSSSSQSIFFVLALLVVVVIDPFFSVRFQIDYEGEDDDDDEPRQYGDQEDYEEKQGG